jgi:regulator of protease activity HflC (stomatin/prohibitin superfamily)
MLELDIENKKFIGLIVLLVPIGMIFLFSLLFLVAKFNLWSSALKGESELRRADWNRQIQVREAQAKLDASVMLAKSEIERAKGVAEANKIIGESLKGNEAYLRYLWIDSLQHTEDKIIYVPTEAGLPILEANRLGGK